MRGKRLLEFRKPVTGELITFRMKSLYIFPDGRVWNHRRRRFLKQIEIFGYMHVALRDDSGKWNRTIRVHNLVASVFQRLLQKGDVVHHINHIRDDNRLENLVILTASEHQHQHSIEKWQSGTFDGLAAKLRVKMKEAWESGAFEGHGEKVKKAWKDGRMNGVAAQASERAKKAWAAGAHKGQGKKVGAKLSKRVAQLDNGGRLVRVWPSTNEAGRNNFCAGHVSNCCNGKLKAHHGYRWMWYEEYIAQQPTPQQRWEARQTYLNFSE